MFRVLQIVLLITIGIAFVLYSIWASENPSPRIIAAVAAVIAYISILWLVFRGDSDGWRRASAVWTARALTSTPARAALSLVVALAVAIVFGLLLFKPRPKPNTPNFVVQVFNNGRANPVNGVEVKLKNLISQEQHEGVTKDEEGVRFQVASSGIWQTAVIVVEGATRRSATRAPEDVEVLPHAQVIDLQDIKTADWSGVTSGTAPVEFATARVETADAVRAISPTTTSTEKKCLSGHSPYGVPAAEIVVCRDAYAVGFDPKRRLARWVAYAMKPAEKNLKRRHVPYVPDPEIPENVQAKTEAYVQNPYDLGHLVSRNDIGGWGENGENEVFYMSVVAPQLDVLNRQIWAEIEIRTQVFMRLNPEPTHIVAGPAFIPPTGQTNITYAILGEQVAVPTHFFRIAYRHSTYGPTKIMAFLVPNTDEARGKDIARYLTSVDEIEAATGLDFFASFTKKEPSSESRKTTLWEFESP